MRHTRLLPLLAACAIAVAVAAPARAGAARGRFAVTIGTTTYVGDQQRIIPAAQVAGKIVRVKGTYVDFSVAMDTFRVYSFTLTGAPGEDDVTGGVRTTVYTTINPTHGKTLTGNLELRLSSEQVILRRSGGGITMKLRAKDQTRGDLIHFQPSLATNIAHQLAPAFHYYRDAAGRLLFTNNVFPGRQFPELATLVRVDEANRLAVWRVSPNGEIETTIGEDALE
jgi:hypothetical protein